MPLLFFDRDIDIIFNEEINQPQMEGLDMMALLFLAPIIYIGMEVQEYLDRK